jgi:hypothetical protein
VWELQKRIIAGGVTAVGIDPSSKYLVVVSHSGRGIFRLSDGSRVARDKEIFGKWYHGAECDGFGPLHGVKVPIFGMGSETPGFVLNEMRRSNIDFKVEELRGVVISLDRRWMCVGYSDEIQIFAQGN